VEFGCSQDPGDRLLQHLSRDNPNYLFNLTRAINIVILKAAVTDHGDPSPKC